MKFKQTKDGITCYFFKMPSLSSKKNRQTDSLKIALKLKELCRTLIKERVLVKADKEKLAYELGISVGGVDGLVYLGKGSFESYFAALTHLYGLEMKDLEKILFHFRESFKQMGSPKISDKMWTEFDKYYSEDFKEFLITLYVTAAQLPYKISVEKLKSSG